MPVDDRSLAPPGVSDTDMLWRYMDFWKFRSLVKTGGLFFAHLVGFTDRLEGRFHRGTREAEEQDIALSPIDEQERRRAILE
jgi:hypothetical protein